MKPATTKAEFANLLPKEPWYPKLAKGDVELLMNTIEYNQGHFAHMKYGDIRKQLTEKEFDEFLGVVGISKKRFEECNGRFCTGDMATRHCAQGAGVCDESWCHGN